MSWEDREQEIKERVRTRTVVPAQDAGDLLTEIVRLRALLAAQIDALPAEPVGVVPRLLFPIMRSRGSAPGAIQRVPWDWLAQYSRRVEENHGQTMKQVAARGGLDSSEVWCAYHDRPLRDAPDAATADAWLAEQVRWTPPAETARLPVIATCGDCAHLQRDPGGLHCAHDGLPRILADAARTTAPPSWCPLRKEPA